MYLHLCDINDVQYPLYIGNNLQYNSGLLDQEGLNFTPPRLD